MRFRSSRSVSKKDTVSTAASIARAESHEPSLIVTVDCGISCKDEVNAVLADGIDVVVTDHHEPGARCPKAFPWPTPM